ncbi:MAG: reverse transcriptase domain-containing protein [bacterium]
MVRYGDDLLVLCPSKERAEAALRALRAILADLGLAVSEAKVQMVDLSEKGRGIDFLSYVGDRVKQQDEQRSIRSGSGVTRPPCRGGRAVPRRSSDDRPGPWQQRHPAGAAAWA